MASFHEKMITFVAFRDIAHEEMERSDGKDLLSRRFLDYRKYLFGGPVSPEIEQTRIRQIWVNEKSHAQMQSRQYSLFLKPFIGSGGAENDTRVWDVFSSYPFSGNHITIKFFRKSVSRSSPEGESVEPSKPDGGPRVWEREPSTEFERLVYLMFVINNSEDVSSGVKRKRRGMPKKVRTFKCTTEHGCKLAFVLQRVIRTWDRCARKFGFATMEEMVLPYIVPSTTFDCFEVLDNRQDGYSPEDIRRTFSERLSPTTDPRLVSRRAYSLSDEVDRDFRRIARYFLADLYLVAEDSELYKKSVVTWTHGDIFPAGGGTSRFDDIMGLLEGLSQMLGIGTDLAFSSDDRRGPILDSPTLFPEGSATSDLLETNPVKVCKDDCECHEARKKVRSFMRPFMRMHNTSFNHIIEADSSLRPLGTTDIEGNVQLILTDMPLEIKMDDGNDGRSDDMASPDSVDEGMMQTVAVLSQLPRPGGHLVMFCSMEQFEIFRELLENLADEKEETDLEEGESAEAENLFSVDSQPFQIVFEPEYNDLDIEAVKNVSFRTASTQAIHARRNGVPAARASKMVRLRRFGHVHSRHPATCNVIDNVPSLRRRRVFSFENNFEEGDGVFRVDEMSLDLLREFICRFSLPGDIVVDLISQRFSTAVACCTIRDEMGGKIRTFVGTEVDEKLFASGVRRVENTVAGIIADDVERANLFSSNEFSSEIIEAAHLVHEHASCSKIIRNKNMWLPPPDLPLTNILPRYITEHLLLRFHAIHHSRKVNGKSFRQWPPELQEAMQHVDMESLMAVECYNCGVYIAPSLIKHRDAGVGVFANRNFSRNDLIATFYGVFVYEDLSNRVPVERCYGEGFTAFSISDYLTYSISVKVSKECDFSSLIQTNASRTTSKYLEVFIVPFRFCVAGRINDARYRDGDLERHTDKKRSCNVQYIQLVPFGKLKTLKQLTETDVIQIIATRDIRKNEELYVDYGNMHSLNVRGQQPRR